MQNHRERTGGVERAGANHPSPVTVIARLGQGVEAEDSEREGAAVVAEEAEARQEAGEHEATILAHAEPLARIPQDEKGRDGHDADREVLVEVRAAKEDRRGEGVEE